MIQAIKKKFSGSVLVFTLLALSVLLLGALSLATATLVGQKTAKNTDSSMQAFQSADSGAERVLAILGNANSGTALSDATVLGPDCSGTTYTGNIRSGASTYTVSFYDGTDPNPLNCSASVGDVQEIKSVGEFAGTSRAIKTAVAHGGSGGITGGCTTSNGPPTVSTAKWGEGCQDDGPLIPPVCSVAAESGYECGVVWSPSGPGALSTHCLCTSV